MNYLRWNNIPGNYDWNLRRNAEVKRCGIRPSTNILESEDAFTVQLAIPGYSKKDINISVDKDILTIASEKEVEENANFTRMEFETGSFSRSFTLPESIDIDGIKADFKNGILVITLPKMEEVKVKKEIKIA